MDKSERKKKIQEHIDALIIHNISNYNTKELTTDLIEIIDIKNIKSQLAINIRDYQQNEVINLLKSYLLQLELQELNDYDLKIITKLDEKYYPKNQICREFGFPIVFICRGRVVEVSYKGILKKNVEVIIGLIESILTENPLGFDVQIGPVCPPNKFSVKVLYNDILQMIMEIIIQKNDEERVQMLMKYLYATPKELPDPDLSKYLSKIGGRIRDECNLHKGDGKEHWAGG